MDGYGHIYPVRKTLVAMGNAWLVSSQACNNEMRSPAESNATLEFEIAMFQEYCISGTQIDKVWKVLLMNALSSQEVPRMICSACFIRICIWAIVFLFNPSFSHQANDL